MSIWPLLVLIALAILGIAWCLFEWQQQSGNEDE